MPVRINVQFPMGAVKHYERWIGEGHLVDFARTVEVAGFDATSMTDHPFPPDAWLRSGGHHAFDPFVALSFVAAATSSLRLLTNLLVAGYRNPYLAAKGIASLDLLSGGRMTVGMGAGYLAPEFEALGADFPGRGRWFDESVRAMRAAWSGESVAHDCELFGVHGHTMLPRPAGDCSPPIWIGGNSERAMRRAAELGDGWMPFFQSETMARVTGTSALTSIGELASRIAALRAMRPELGRQGPFDVCCGNSTPAADDPHERARHLARDLPALEDAGVTWITVELTSHSWTDGRIELEILAEHLLRAAR